MVHVLADDVESHLMPDLSRMAHAAGLITICSMASEMSADLQRAKELIGDDAVVEIEAAGLPSSDAEALGQITTLLENRGFIRPDDRGLDGAGI